ncbi:TPR-like protein [Cenococcum geophilum 1.58]|uniref:TPR-like protein n=1 Tax=Cenococcum geophilum 1.58 TaxID=794803 RepID=A0ACC8EN62_9PEZI|nr:TPR-like protein [Cenococcum geophilum 1.58]
MQQMSISDQLEVSDLQFELDQLDYDRCPDTGIWLLENQAFIDFVQCEYSASFHLCGNPGSGKTFLSSKVIDELREYFAEMTSTSLIYFLCDGKTDASNRRTSLAVLKSLTAQLLERITAVDTAFVRTNVEALGMVKRKAKDIPEGQLFKILEKCLRYFKKCYLVVDAVDECDDWGNLVQIFTRLLDANVCTLKFFLSSQKGMGIPYIISQLPVAKNYQVDVTTHAAESDITRYVNWRVRTLDLRSLGSPEEARDSLIHGCDGLFLLVRLRLDILTKEILPLGTDVKAAISDLPSEIFPLYERLLDRLNDAHKSLAQILFIWVIHAQTVLTVQELMEAYRIELEDVRDFAAPSLSESEIEGLSGGLIEVHEGRVRLAHSTVRNFATWYNWGTLAKVSEMDQHTLNRRLFSKCLDYIATPTLVSQVMSALQLPSDLQTSWPLADYAGRHWLAHLRLCSTSTAELSKKIIKFIQSDAGLAWWICYTNHIELHNWWTLPEISADINAWLHGNREAYRSDPNIADVVPALCQRHVSALEGHKSLIRPDFYIPALLRLAGQKLDHGYTNEAETIVNLAIGQSDRISSIHGRSMKYQAVLDLTVLLRYEGRYHEALQLCEGLQSDFQKVGDNSSRQLISASQSIGLIAGESGQLAKSELHLRNLLDTTMRKFGANDPDSLAIVHALALTCFNQSKYREAERLWDIKYFKTVLGKNHPSTLTITECLADLKRAQGKFGYSRQIRMEVLSLRQARQGAQSVDTIRSEIGLAYCMRDQGEAAEAIANLRRLLDTTCKRFSDDHFLVLELKVALAELCSAAGDLTTAETFQLEVVEKRSQRLGGRHIWTVSEKTRLAAIHLEQRKYQMAAVLLSEIRNVRMEEYETDYRGLCGVVELLARSKRSTGALQEAEELGCHALKLARKNGDEDNPGVLNAMANLAITKGQRGQFDEAQQLEERVLELRQKTMDEDNPDVLTAMASLAITKRQRASTRRHSS